MPLNQVTSDQDSRTDVAICVATYRRPRGLRALLNGIAALDIGAGVSASTIQVVIVDNDADGSAAPVAQEALAWLPWRVRYVIEPRRGIAQARNRAIREVINAPFIAFIDDDEVPDPNWLYELLTAQKALDADVVCGPVVHSFSSQAPAWIRDGRFFERERHSTGQLLNTTRTGNVLVRNGLFRVVGNFNEQFGLTGGEDTEFFARAYKAGFRIFWCNEAIVSETIGPERMTMKWLLRRAYQGGNTYARYEATVRHPARLRWVRLLKGFLHVSRAFVEIPIASCVGSMRPARELCRLAMGFGMIAGAAGIGFAAYRHAGETGYAGTKPSDGPPVSSDAT